MLVATHSAGRLAENVMHFVRVLRAAGLPLGSQHVQLCLQALQVVGLESRQDFHSVLSACLVSRVEQQLLFDQAFEIFWRDPDLEGRMRAMLLPKVQLQPGALPAPPQNRRLGEALFPHQAQAPPPPPDLPEQIEIDAALTWNDQERLHKADFDTMSVDEWSQAKRLMSQMRVALPAITTRRQRRATRPGRLDFRATQQAMARHGGELWDLRWRAPTTRPAPLVLLADISGSMSRYSRMLLHFAHVLAQAHTHVESFVFGTRLTRTTRWMAQRDPDLAVAQVVRAVDDWSGGTRITTSLHEFNQRWGRRVLSGNATVLLISDGLEHGDTAQLSFEMERLHKSCRHLIWLNPLLRFDAFEPRAGGIRAMLGHVDRFLPTHNLHSLAELADALAQPKHAARRLTERAKTIAATRP